LNSTLLVLLCKQLWGAYKQDPVGFTEAETGSGRVPLAHRAGGTGPKSKEIEKTCIVDLVVRVATPPSLSGLRASTNLANTLRCLIGHAISTRMRGRKLTEDFGLNLKRPAQTFPQTYGSWLTANTRCVAAVRSLRKRWPVGVVLEAAIRPTAKIV